MVMSVLTHTDPVSYAELKMEEFVENSPPQQWIKGDPDEHGFFPLTNLLTKKFLTAGSDGFFLSLKLMGKYF